MLYQKIQEELHRLRQQLNEIQIKLSAFPDGKLICSRGKNCFKWNLKREMKVDLKFNIKLARM